MDYTKMVDTLCVERLELLELLRENRLCILETLSDM